MITRFAPSPTGLLHLGHAFSALTAWDMSQAAGGQFLLRLEDIDTPRCKAEYEAAIYEELDWLGLRWRLPILRQSGRQSAYDAALGKLADLGLTYPCSCSRTDIRAALSAPQEGAPANGPDGPLYPGTCRGRSMTERGADDAVRLNMAAVGVLLGPKVLGVDETGARHAGSYQIGAADLPGLGDIVLARRDIGTSYHLAVVVDEAAQGVSHVVRGRDLFAATPIHVLLQHLLGLPTPSYHHHRLIRDARGKRLAKRDDARSLRSLRQQGKTRADIRNMLGL
ncbi:MAG TPA: tRNA glutamyl-Q(34) synthetase GluQRS [Aliiroseovarius sp.]|nr:tRNA glutamyl-Q(34) synthetase GluQRS [Aliiroseovarius sp.]